MPVCAGGRFNAKPLDGCSCQVVRGQCIVSLASSRRLCMRGVWHVQNLGGLFNQRTSANVHSALRWVLLYGCILAAPVSVRYVVLCLAREV